MYHFFFPSQAVSYIFYIYTAFPPKTSCALQPLYLYCSLPKLSLFKPNCALHTLHLHYSPLQANLCPTYLSFKSLSTQAKLCPIYFTFVLLPPQAKLCHTYSTFTLLSPQTKLCLTFTTFTPLPARPKLYCTSVTRFSKKKFKILNFYLAFIKDPKIFDAFFF